mgnify:CR=1 FL=1|jgi:uncharacterized protein YjiS (DUF1127 family)
MTRPHDATAPTLLALLRRWLGRVRGTGAASADALELRGMSDHELNDLGIGRSEVQEWSRRKSPGARPGATERKLLRQLADGRFDLAPANLEHRQHDGLERLCI